MARRTFSIWTSTIHTRFQRALNNPEFKGRIMTQMKVSDSTLKNWLTQADVPATKRADVKALLDAWDHEVSSQQTLK